MELLHLALRYAHLLGFAALTIGALIQWSASNREVNKLMLYGSLTQLITGFTLVGVVGSLGEDLNMTKISIKLGLVVMTTIILFINRKKALSQSLYVFITALIVSASLVAVFL